MPPDNTRPPAGPAGAQRRRVPRRGLATTGLVAVALAVLVVVTGVLGRARQATQVRTWTQAQDAPAVSVVSPSTRDAAASLVLPGQLQAYYNAAIYSRVSGYVQSWSQDIGARVRKGELLAVIDTPETDAQIVQARADLATAQANMNLARTTADRWSRLLKQDAVSAQESEEKAGDFAAKAAMVQAARANLDRLLALKGFSRITAPFDGVITARRTDIGALVNAGAGATTNSELFDVAEVDRLRLYVDVPEASAAAMRPGAEASFTVPELPGRQFQARLSTTADAISEHSGTLQTELMVDNRKGALKPGAYAQVRFEATGAGTPGGVVLPSSALLFRDRGAQIAVVDSTDHVRLHRVQIGRNFGGSMQVLSGVAPSDRVIDNPPDSLAEGEVVRVAGAKGAG